MATSCATRWAAPCRTNDGRDKRRAPKANRNANAMATRAGDGRSSSGRWQLLAPLDGLRLAGPTTAGTKGEHQKQTGTRMLWRRGLVTDGRPAGDGNFLRHSMGCAMQDQRRQGQRARTKSKPERECDGDAGW